MPGSWELCIVVTVWPAREFKSCGRFPGDAGRILTPKNLCEQQAIACMNSRVGSTAEWKEGRTYALGGIYLFNAFQRNIARRRQPNFAASFSGRSLPSRNHFSLHLRRRVAAEDISRTEHATGEAGTTAGLLMQRLEPAFKMRSGIRCYSSWAIFSLNRARPGLAPVSDHSST